MSDIERLDAELQRNEALKTELYKAANLDEAVSIVKEKGFNISKEDLECSKELPESVMEFVAAGIKGPRVTRVNVTSLALGKNNSIVSGMEIKS